MVRDGSHVYFCWRRADQVHELAKQYLQANVPVIGGSSVRAILACQDLMELELLRCMENNEPRR